MVQAHLPKNRAQSHLNLQPATIPDHTTFCQGFWVGAYYERKLSRYLIEIHLGMSENGDKMVYTPKSPILMGKIRESGDQPLEREVP